MIWDLFGKRSNVQMKRIDDPLTEIIEAIEKFAPRVHRDARASHYYNYRTIDAYMEPLKTLLTFISEQRHRKEEPAWFACELFLKLKNFYDHKNKLSLAEAMQDIGLKRKLSQIFLFFYDEKEMGMGILEDYLKQIKKKK